MLVLRCLSLQLVAPPAGQDRKCPAAAAVWRIKVREEAAGWVHRVLFPLCPLSVCLLCSLEDSGPAEAPCSLRLSAALCAGFCGSVRLNLVHQGRWSANNDPQDCFVLQVSAEQLCVFQSSESCAETMDQSSRTTSRTVCSQPVSLCHISHLLLRTLGRSRVTFTLH